MLVWFTVLAGLGIYQIAQNPTVLKALNPLEGFHFLTHHGKSSLVIIGGVFLVVTGGESLYADLGHFGRPAIARAWTFVVCPALMLNYLGQGALALSDPSSRDSPFFHMGPEWMLYPLVALATAAAVIASQALISGVFSPHDAGNPDGLHPAHGNLPHLRRTSAARFTSRRSTRCSPSVARRWSWIWQQLRALANTFMASPSPLR